MAQFLANAFLPSLTIGLALCLAWRHVDGRLRTALQWIGSLLFFVPQALILFFLHRSVDLLVYQEAVLAFWMITCGGLLLAKVSQGWFKGETPASLSGRRQNPFLLLVLGFGVGALGIFFGVQFVGDTCLPRKIIEGHTQDLKVFHGTRSPSSYTIFIEGQPCAITRDLLLQLKRGEKIRAEVGAGSNYILKIEQAR